MNLDGSSDARNILSLISGVVSLKTIWSRNNKCPELSISPENEIIMVRFNNTGILAATSSARPTALSVFDEFAIVKSETFHISYENALQFY